MASAGSLFVLNRSMGIFKIIGATVDLPVYHRDYYYVSEFSESVNIAIKPELAAVSLTAPSRGHKSVGDTYACLFTT
jgi:hypothetical protein